MQHGRLIKGIDNWESQKLNNIELTNGRPSDANATFCEYIQIPATNIADVVNRTFG